MQETSALTECVKINRNSFTDQLCWVFTRTRNEVIFSSTCKRRKKKKNLKSHSSSQRRKTWSCWAFFFFFMIFSSSQTCSVWRLLWQSSLYPSKEQTAHTPLIVSHGADFSWFVSGGAAERKQRTLWGGVGSPDRTGRTLQQPHLTAEAALAQQTNIYSWWADALTAHKANWGGKLLCFF